MEEYPYFSVIIPQKDRAEYIGWTLRTCMIQDYPNFEIIVSDDCSEDNSVEVISKLAEQDKRIKLFAHKEHLGMRDNFEFALSQVKPGYVIALGGDDGLVPGCIWQMYKILKETGRQLLTWAPAGFHYPKDPGDKNLLYVKRRKNDAVRFIKSEDFLNKLAKTFHYQIDECPMFYMKGVASTELVEKVKSRTSDGCFYYCPTPDGFSGVVLAGEVEDFAYTDMPLSITGDTVKSQGKNYMRADKKSRFESQQFFNDNIRRTMHKELASQPYSPLTTLMTADYLLTARDLPGWPGKFEMFSFESLLKASFDIMANNPFADEVLVRELIILKEIAKQHNLEPLFDSLYKNTRRKVMVSKGIPFTFLITNSIRFEGTSIGINNIFDACLVVNFVHGFYKQINGKFFRNFIKNSFKLVLRRKKYKYIQFPAID